MDELGATLAAGIRAERVRAGLTQDDIADRLGVDQAVIARIESGARPVTAGDELAALCAAIGVSLDRLLIEATPEQRAALGL